MKIRIIIVIILVIIVYGFFEKNRKETLYKTLEQINHSCVMEQLSKKVKDGEYIIIGFLQMEKKLKLSCFVKVYIKLNCHHCPVFIIF